MPTTTETSVPGRKIGRKYFWAISLVSMLIMLGSATMLAIRIDRYNTEEDHDLFAFIDVTVPAFSFNDHPFEISETQKDGNDILRVNYADQILDLDVAIEPRQKLLPTLFDRQADWMKLLYFADRSGMRFDEFRSGIDDGTIPPRLIIVTRTPFGVDAPKEARFENIGHEENWVWGEVRRDRWRFDFYEFMEDGSVLQHEPLRFPESGKSLLRRQNYAKLKGEPIPQRGDGELEEYTWQYGAALSVMPRAPAITFEKQALRGAGWTLPVSAGSFLLMMVSFFFAIAPARVIDPGASPASA